MMLGPLLLLAATAQDPVADAAERRPDGAHGRFEGDLGLAVAAGATFGPRAPRATLDLRLRYLSTAGVFATYEEGFGGSEPGRLLAFGLEIRPLFLARWATNRELGRPRLDLLIDSFALELGAVLSQPDGTAAFGRRGLQAGIGLALPFLATASTPFVAAHAGCRWSDDALAGGPLAGPGDRSLFLSIEIGFQQLFGAHLADLGDRRAP